MNNPLSFFPAAPPKLCMHYYNDVRATRGASGQTQQDCNIGVSWNDMGKYRKCEKNPGNSGLVNGQGVSTDVAGECNQLWCCMITCQCCFTRSVSLLNAGSAASPTHNKDFPSCYDYYLTNPTQDPQASIVTTAVTWGNHGLQPATHWEHFSLHLCMWSGAQGVQSCTASQCCLPSCDNVNINTPVLGDPSSAASFGSAAALAINGDFKCDAGNNLKNPFPEASGHPDLAQPAVIPSNQIILTDGASHIPCNWRTEPFEDEPSRKPMVVLENPDCLKDACCTRTCEALPQVTCGDGLILRDNLGSIDCAGSTCTQGECCKPDCTEFVNDVGCGSDFRTKESPPAGDILCNGGNGPCTSADCCDPYCDAWVNSNNPGACPPATHYEKTGLDSILCTNSGGGSGSAGCDVAQCCEPLQFCPSNFV